MAGVLGDSDTNMYRPFNVCQNFVSATAKRSTSSLSCTLLSQAAKYDTVRTGITCNYSGIVEVHHQRQEKIVPRVSISRTKMPQAKTEVLHVNLVSLII